MGCGPFVLHHEPVYNHRVFNTNIRIRLSPSLLPAILLAFFINWVSTAGWTLFFACLPPVDFLSQGSADLFTSLFC